jgi:glycosyltransferase involved in cell wall biosynthesis
LEVQPEGGEEMEESIRGVPFVSIAGVTGITVPPREPEALAAITRLLNNAELRARYRAAGARRVRDEFSLETVTARTLDLYDEVLSDDTSASSDATRRSLAL